VKNETGLIALLASYYFFSFISLKHTDISYFSSLVE